MNIIQENRTASLHDAPLFTSLHRFVQNGGPDLHEYDELTRLWTELAAKKQADTYQAVQHIFDDIILAETVQGFAYRKPHGYAGDYEIIDMIYRSHVNSDERFKKWDLYFHEQAAPKAVRNRKRYFIELVKQKIQLKSTPVTILNIASGPCRDIYELLLSVPAGAVHIECVEMDAKAIAYAKKLLGSYADEITFHEKNIFRFDTPNQFDLVWSAGLFDYFDDRYFIRLLQKIARWAAPNGETVIGNFSDDNPSRCYMEEVGQWFLHHRSKQQLAQLAAHAGFAPGSISVQHEELGINLFLHLQTTPNP